MIPVILESPYKGQVHRNKAYLQLCIRDSTRRGETPFCSHQMFTDALNDDDEEERALGIEAGLVWGTFAKRTVVYTDFGISTGMRYGIANAERASRPVEYRKLENFDKDAFFTRQDEAFDAPWEELLFRALGRRSTPQQKVAHGACAIVFKRVQGETYVLGLEGPKGTGLPGGRIEQREKPEVAARRELGEETGLAVKPGATMMPLDVRQTDNGDIAHGFWIHDIETFGELRESPEGIPVWLRPWDLVLNRAGHPPVRFPKYNEWALRSLFLLDDRKIAAEE